LRGSTIDWGEYEVGWVVGVCEGSNVGFVMASKSIDNKHPSFDDRIADIGIID
jgi:hypothetical protein